MKYLIFILALSSLAQSKLEKSKKAHDDFLNLHFFENGRGMTISPNISKYLSFFRVPDSNGLTIPENKKSLYKRILQDRYGLNVLEDQVAGLFNIRYKGMDVGVLGCVACHGGKAAGRFYSGLGNKTIDVYKVGVDAKIIQGAWGALRKDPEFKKIHKVAMNFSKVISDKSISNLTRGLIPDSVIKTYFYKDAGLSYKGKISRAQVKVPHLWGLKEKRKTGIFWGAEFDGTNIGWEFGAELFASDSEEHLRAVLPKLKRSVENIVYNLESPKYPFHIKEDLAKIGKVLFDNKCSKCHGVHQRGLDGYPLYHQPKFIKSSIVKTDTDRLKGFFEYKALVESSSISDILPMNQRTDVGYVAPNLWGIWARFPYLHNGSVPSLYDLLKEPSKRPKFFNMFDAGEEYRFDKNKVGLTREKENSRKFTRNLRKAKQGNRNIYFVEREGHSNIGHYYNFMRSYSEQDILSIVEYLKTL